MMHTINSCHLSTRDRVAYSSSYGFLGNAISVFGGLLVGGTICPSDVTKELDLVGWLQRAEITVLMGSHILRPLLRMLDGTETFPRLRLSIAVPRSSTAGRLSSTASISHAAVCCSTPSARLRPI